MNTRIILSSINQLNQQEYKMSAIYKGLQFKTSLEARWAAFFDLAGWEWHVNPAPVGDWLPDFKVSFPCSHSECDFHTLLIAVLPLSTIDSFGNHPSLEHQFFIQDDLKKIHVGVGAGAVFGASPAVTRWEFAHGSGGGQYEVTFFVDDAHDLWSQAKDLVLSA